MAKNGIIRTLARTLNGKGISMAAAKRREKANRGVVHSPGEVGEEIQMAGGGKYVVGPKGNWIKVKS